MKAGFFKRVWDTIVGWFTRCGYCNVYSVDDYIKKYKLQFKFQAEDYVQIAKQFNTCYGRLMDQLSKTEAEKVKNKIKEQ